MISNDDCLTIKKKKLKNKSVNDLVLNTKKINQIGKIIIDNNQFLTIQKGRPYFFPNCEVENSINDINLRYKLISENHLPFSKITKTKRLISLNYYDVTKNILNKKLDFNLKQGDFKGSKIELPKMFIKRVGIYTVHQFLFLLIIF